MKKQMFYLTFLAAVLILMSAFCVSAGAQNDEIEADGGYFDAGQLFPELDTDKCMVEVVHKTIDGAVLESWKIKGVEGEAYSVASQKYYGYILKEAPSNASGTFTGEQITVTYVYEKLNYDFSVDKEKVSFDRIYENCVLFVASYFEGKLVDARCRVIDETDSYSSFSYDVLGLDVTDADRIKAVLLSDMTSLRPVCVNRSIKLGEEEQRDAYCFMNSTGSYTNSLSQRDSTIRENIKSGWVYDNRGGKPLISIERPINTIRDVSETQGTALIREFNRIDKDVIKADYKLRASGDGAYTEFRDEAGNSVYQIKLIDGMWSILTTHGDYSAIAKADVSGYTADAFRVYLDFRNGVSKTYINGEYLGEHKLLSDNAVNFRFATDEESTVEITPLGVEMTANYALYESFDNYGVEEIYGWETNGNVSWSGGQITLNGRASVKNMFEPVDDKYVAETYIYRSANENMSLSLTSQNTIAVKVEANGGKLYANGTELYTLMSDMWYRLRIESDPASAKAKIYLNGRVVGNVGLYTINAVDGYTISSQSGKTSYDNIKVYEIAEHNDYVPAPEAKADLSDYIVFINVCSLWINDIHTGWSCITPYDTSKPVLGYYDEGNPELADWEINYLVNHGVDVQVFCWYNSSSKDALKQPGNSWALHDGYMYSKYSDYMKYIIMLETASTPFDSEQFRKHIVPYWFENYFLDDRYLKIDNKIVLHSWYAGRLSGANYFGVVDETTGELDLQASIAAAKSEMDYLNEVAKSYGFDGVILTCADGAGSSAYQFGFEANGAYHWDEGDNGTTSGNTYDINVKKNIAQAEGGKTDNYYHIPTISVGFDCVPWYGRERDPLMSVDEYEQSHDWVKNTYIPTYGTTGTWKDRAVWISTWNEYGEGTYVMPSGLNGFGYMDVLRNAYTVLPEAHTDFVPTESQLERITHRYPQYARKLWREQYVTYDSPSRDYNFGNGYEYEYDTLNTYKLRDRNFYEKITGVSANYGATFTFNSDGSVKGTTTTDDPQVYVYNAKNASISDTCGVRVTMQIPEGSRAEVFFSTTTDKSINPEKAVSVTANTSEMCEYVFLFDNNEAWTGTLNLIRIDPVSTEIGVEFYIKNVELIQKKALSLEINGINSTSKVPYSVCGERILFPYDPETSIHYNLYVLHNWKKDEGVLEIQGNGHKVVYTVGKSTFTVDGVEESLGYTVELYDGLPLIDMEQLAFALDYETRRVGAKIIIETPEFYMYEATLAGIEEAKNGRWEFNTNDTLGFSANNGIISIDDGYMHVENTQGFENVIDLQVQNSETYAIDTSSFNQLEVRARHDYSSFTTATKTFSLYYLTDTDKSWNEAKSIKASLEGASSNGEWVTYVVELPDGDNDPDLWTGTLTNIRFDPFDAKGYMDVDYIRFTYNPNLVPETKLNLIENGNAEDTQNTAFYSSYGVVTIEEDEKCSNNHVYNVEPKSDDSKYLYFLKEFAFEENTKYKVSFMARALEDANGNMVDMKLGCNMEIDSGIGVGLLHLGTDEKWKTFEATFTVPTVTNKDAMRFRLYAEAASGSGVSAFQVDNIVLTKVE